MTDNPNVPGPNGPDRPEPPIPGLDPSLADLPTATDVEAQMAEGTVELSEAFQSGDIALAEAAIKKVHGDDTELSDDLRKGLQKKQEHRTTNRLQDENPNRQDIANTREEHELWVVGELAQREKALGRHMTEAELGDFELEARKRIHNAIARYYADYN